MTRPAMTRGPGPGTTSERTVGIDTTELPGRRRFALRARAVRRASLWWKLGVPLVVVIIAAALWFVWSGPVLVLRSVTVRGVPSADVAEVRRAAALPMGRPMLRLDLEAARERVRALRSVRAVTVSRSWPTGVVVSVTVRTPVAVVKDASGRLHLADSTGTTYADVSVAPKDLPVVSADAANPAAVQTVVDVLAALPAAVRAQVTSAEAKGPDAVILRLGRAGAVTVEWGSADETQLKASVLQTLRRQNPRAHHFDLSAPRAPSVG
jgi:cell division protein FtsQ